MGFLRFFLAATVIAEHSTPFLGFSFTGGHLAVRLFFIISGFYMMLILSTKYTTETPKRYSLFLTNRALRIYPGYLAIFGLSVLFYVAASIYLQKPADRLLLWQDAWERNMRLELFFLAICQFSIVGMDTVCILVYDLTHGLYLPGAGTQWADVTWLPTTAASPTGIVPAWRFLFVPQAWSISIELLFYLVVPWLSSWRTRALVFLGAVCVAASWCISYTVNQQLSQLVNYFFFPLHLPLFVLGMLAYRHGKAYLNWLPAKAKVSLVAATIAALFFSQFLPVTARNLTCITLVFLSLPILFDWTKASPTQKIIGDLSYPLYICHILVKWILLALGGISIKGTPNSTPSGWLMLIVSTLLAGLMLWMIDHPIDKWRQRRLKRGLQKAPASRAAAPTPIITLSPPSDETTPRIDHK
jgi:peptidoglycan/LPS O-acetylase OafA/YrhL